MHLHSATAVALLHEQLQQKNATLTVCGKTQAHATQANMQQIQSLMQQQQQQLK